MPRGRLVVFLEGGYDLGSLAMCVGACVAALGGVDYRPEAASGGEITDEVREVIADGRPLPPGGADRDETRARFSSEFPERLRPVLEATQPIAERFQAAGKQLYLVGGPVRDVIAGRPGGGEPGPEVDIDLTSDATPDEVEALVVRSRRGRRGPRARGSGRSGSCAQGAVSRSRRTGRRPTCPTPASPRCVSATTSRPTFRGGTSPSTPWRSACRSSSSSIPSTASPTSRDRRLRTPLDPEVSFSDDPLRMLRAARFIAGYELEPDAELVTAVESMTSRLEIVSRERIRDELDKLLDAAGARPGVSGSSSTPGSPMQFLPELPALALEQDPIQRHKDVLAHTIAVVEKASPDGRSAWRRCSTTSASPCTRSIGPGGVHFHHHDVVGAKMARKRMQELRYPTEVIEDVARLVELHLRFHTYKMGWTDSAVRRYAHDAGPSARSAERADPLRLHDAQPGQGARARRPHGRARAAPRRARVRRRSSMRSVRSSTASRS